MLQLSLFVLIFGIVSGEGACPSYSYESHENQKCVLYNNLLWYDNLGYYKLFTMEKFCKEINGKLLGVENMTQMEEYMNKVVSVLDENYPGELTMTINQKLLIGKIGKEDGCHFVEWNADKQQWTSEKSSCQSAKRNEGEQFGFVCEFPTYSIQEYQNVPECGIAERDLIDDRLTEWPAHIEIAPDGTPVKSREKRIVHGVPTTIEFWPWYVVGDCGATLIHPRFVISANHCGKFIDLRFAFDRSEENYENTTVRIKSTQVIQYPDPDIDFQILVLDTPVEFVKGRIQPMCLPEWRRAAFSRDNYAFVAGYGYTKGQEWPGTELHLQQLQLWLRLTSGGFIEAQPTNKTLHNLVNGHYGNVARGDSGGPIIFRGKDEKKWKLAAPVLKGGGSAVWGPYIGHLKPWIDLTIHNLNVEGQWSD